MLDLWFILYIFNYNFSAIIKGTIKFPQSEKYHLVMCVNMFLPVVVVHFGDKYMCLRKSMCIGMCKVKENQRLSRKPQTYMHISL